MGARDYYESYPIRTRAGGVVGVAIMAKTLESFQKDLRLFERPSFLVNKDGVVVMTNRPEALYCAFWPFTEPQRAELTARFGTLLTHPMLEHGLVDATWTSVDGERNYVRRRLVNHGDWSP